MCHFSETQFQLYLIFSSFSLLCLTVSFIYIFTGGIITTHPTRIMLQCHRGTEVFHSSESIIRFLIKSPFHLTEVKHIRAVWHSTHKSIQFILFIQNSFQPKSYLKHCLYRKQNNPIWASA